MELYNLEKTGRKQKNLYKLDQVLKLEAMHKNFSTELRKNTIKNKINKKLLTIQIQNKH